MKNFSSLQTKPQSSLQLRFEELEERIAPSMPPGLRGYEGHPGNQGGHHHHGHHHHH